MLQKSQLKQNHIYVWIIYKDIDKDYFKNSEVQITAAYFTSILHVVSLTNLFFES